MLKKLLLLILLLPLAATPLSACDLDGDGIDDPTTYQDDGLGSYTWQSLMSSDHSTKIVNSFGQTNQFPVPANYLGESEPANYAYIDTSFFWKLLLPPSEEFSGLNFGRADASYLAGHDFNGDGYDDAAKIIDRCTKFRKNCLRRRAFLNVVFNSVEDERPFADVSLTIGFFGNALSPVFVMDANNDGRDNLCIGKPLKKKRKIFKFRCYDIETEAVVQTFKTGRLHNLPLSANINGADVAVLWKAQNRKGRTQIRLIDANGNTTTAYIDVTGTVLVGDWLGTGSDQVGVASNRQLHVFNTLTSDKTVISLPSGTPIDCNNNLYGRAASKYIKSRNVCKVYNCK